MRQMHECTDLHQALDIETVESPNESSNVPDCRCISTWILAEKDTEPAHVP